MTDELIKQLRRNERTAMTPWARDDFKMAADLIEQQATRIAALEAKVASGGERDAVLEEAAQIAELIPLETFTSESYIRQSKRNRQQIVDAIRALQHPPGDAPA